VKTLPPVSRKVRGHDLAFPFNIRRLVGAWKLLFLRSWLLEPDPSKSAQWNRGAYLVNGPGHCAECHSPRNFLGAIIEEERFAGGRAADGNGWVPSITSAGLQHWSKDDLAWSEKDIASFLADGMNPAGEPAARWPKSFATLLCSARPTAPPSRRMSPRCRRRGGLTSTENNDNRNCI
jgi:mono/diheme cytochrome c family protein